jgi:hypothetical protein
MLHGKVGSILYTRHGVHGWSLGPLGRVAVQLGTGGIWFLVVVVPTFGGKVVCLNTTL